MAGGYIAAGLEVESASKGPDPEATCLRGGRPSFSSAVGPNEKEGPAADVVACEPLELLRGEQLLEGFRACKTYRWRGCGDLDQIGP
jgi:hypothetical protein